MSRRHRSTPKSTAAPDSRAASTATAADPATTICKQVTTKYRGTHLLDGPRHWVQQEQPGPLAKLLLDFLRVENIR